GWWTDLRSPSTTLTIIALFSMGRPDGLAILGCWRLPRLGLFLGNAHRVERSPYEKERDREHYDSRNCEVIPPSRDMRFLKRDRDLHRKQAEQGRKLDDRVQRHRGRILERIADGIADDGRR